MTRKKRLEETDLRQRIISAMERDVGVSPGMASPLADSVMRCLAGEQPYFPARKRIYPIEEIRADLRSGATVACIMQRYDISRSKLHELFPGGLKANRS